MRGGPPPGSESADCDSQDDTRGDSDDKGTVRKQHTSCSGSPDCSLWTLLSTDYDKTYHGGRVRTSPLDSTLVELVQDGNGNLNVRLKRQGEIVNSYKREVDRNGLRCSSGAYRWSYHVLGGGGLGLGVARESFSLSLDEDGSLVAERRMTIGAALMLVIPVGGQENQWYRWEKHDGT